VYRTVARPGSIWPSPARNRVEPPQPEQGVGLNTAFVLLIFGLLGIYAELVWPGRVIPGALGLGATVAGAYFLFRPPLNSWGVALLALGAALLFAEALWGPYFLAGVPGAAALSAGFYLLLVPPRRIVPVLAIPVSLVFGAVSIFLAVEAKRARRNKWADLTSRK
jgi:membrane-bound serine protease (ClpP class)